MFTCTCTSLMEPSLCSVIIIVSWHYYFEGVSLSDANFHSHTPETRSRVSKTRTRPSKTPCFSFSVEVLMVVHCLLQTTDDINILMEDGKTIKTFLSLLAKPQ